LRGIILIISFWIILFIQNYISWFIPDIYILFELYFIAWLGFLWFIIFFILLKILTSGFLLKLVKQSKQSLVFLKEFTKEIDENFLYSKWNEYFEEDLEELSIKLNNKKEMFPSNIIAWMMMIEKYEMYEADENSKKSLNAKDLFDK
jgi:hypothetical protein